MKTPIKTALLALFTIASLVANAQDEEMAGIPEDKLREIKAQKSAFITQRLDLSPEEAQKFWPVYNQYDKELDANRKDMRSSHKAMKDGGTASETEASAAIDKELAMRQKELDIRKKYTTEFKKTIGAVKTLELGKAERDFHRELVKRVRDRKGPDRGEGGGPRGGQPER